ncbi:MAG TPA: flavin reductase family protein [Terriglobales bacterium]|nr:flavin reductase family protein [Terriglobales bacterium]
MSIVAVNNGGIMHGMTVNSFTSLSLNPPLVLVSLEKVTRTHGLVLSAGVFGVSILAESQRELSNRFAGRESEINDRFSGVETFALETGSPLIKGALAYFDCMVAETHEGGTHTIVIADVLAAGATEENSKQNPLVYFNRNYRRLIDL